MKYAFAFTYSFENTQSINEESAHALFSIFSKLFLTSLETFSFKISIITLKEVGRGGGL